jgi:hypothetical protein
MAEGKLSCGRELNQSYTIHVDDTGQDISGRTSDFQLTTIQMCLPDLMLQAIHIPGIRSVDRDRLYKVESPELYISVRTSKDVGDAVRHFGLESPELG